MSLVGRDGGAGGEQFLVEYAVGKNGDIFPEGTGRLVKAGAKIRFNMHYHPIGEAKTDASQIALVLLPEGLHAEVLLPVVAHRRQRRPRPSGRRRQHPDRRLLAPEPERARHGVPAAPAQPRQGAVHGGDLSRRQDGDAELRRSLQVRLAHRLQLRRRRRAAPAEGHDPEGHSWHNNTSTNLYNPDPQNWAGFGQRSIDDMSLRVGQLRLARRRGVRQGRSPSARTADADRRTPSSNRQQ